jgi:hypothetical protein
MAQLTAKYSLAQREILAKVGQEARALLKEGVEGSSGERRAGPNLRKHAKLLAKLLSDWQQFVDGTITEPEMVARLDEIKRQNPRLFPSAPSWLPENLAIQIRKTTRAAEQEHPKAANELISWIAKEFASPTGRRTCKALDQAYSEAAKLRETGLSWGRVTQRLCPKKVDQSHVCDKGCEDRMRHGAERRKRETPA